MQYRPLGANLHRKLVFQNHAPHPSRKHNFDFFNFHDININMQTEFVLFLSPSGIAFSLVTCAHLWLMAPFAKPVLHKTLAFLFGALFHRPFTSPIIRFFRILPKNASCLGGEHYFAPVPSLYGVQKSLPEAPWELLLSTWEAISRPIILLPANARSIISIFGKNGRKNSISFFFFSRPWK